jgi:hypothetical protein
MRETWYTIEERQFVLELNLFLYYLDTYNLYKGWTCLVKAFFITVYPIKLFPGSILYTSVHNSTILKYACLWTALLWGCIQLVSNIKHTFMYVDSTTKVWGAWSRVSRILLARHIKYQVRKRDWIRCIIPRPIRSQSISLVCTQKSGIRKVIYLWP